MLVDILKPFMSDRPIQTSCRPVSPLFRFRMVNTGFTLIESLIVIFLVGILAAIAAPSFFSWVRNKEVDEVMVQIVGALKEAQSEALRTGNRCMVTITAQEVRAMTLPSPGENCLPTGNRGFSNSTPNLQLFTTISNVPAEPASPDVDRRLIFTHKKTTPNDGIVVIAQPDASRQRCIVVSAGLGLIRTGFYQGNPTVLNESNCNRNP